MSESDGAGQKRSYRFGAIDFDPPKERPKAPPTNKDAALGCLFLLVPLLLLGGCVYMIVDDDESPEQAQAPRVTSPVAPAPTAVSTPSGTPSASVMAVPAAPALTGYAATRRDWDRAHRPAPGYTQGAAYLPFVRGDQPRYAAVSGDDQILSYVYFFELNTGLQEAMQEVLGNEFPDDAKYGRIDRDEPHCLIAEVRSPTVERVMLSDGTQYRPLVAFFSEPPPENPDAPLDPAAIDNATLTVVEAGTEPDLGDC